MANTLEKFYNRFTGVDSRSNKLLQDPGSFRRGAKNMRYNFQDEIQNRQGFQYKDSGAGQFVDIFEYKYRNPNTGQAIVETLGVGIDGALYKKKNHWLGFTSTGAATSISVYYNDVTDLFVVSMNGVGSVSFNKTVQLKDNPTTTASLVGKLNALTGITAKIYDDDGVEVTSSTKLAYLLDCIIADTTFAQNPVYYWEEIPFPNSTGGEVPFPVTFSNYTSSSYEGISSINLNNCIYITDGGFLMKYDGKCVYRAGVPGIRQNLYGGVTTFAAYDQAQLTDATLFSVDLLMGNYGYNFRYCFRDYTGSAYYSDISQYSELRTISAASSGTDISNKGFPYGLDFGIYGCQIDYAAGSATAGGTGAGGAHTYSTDYTLYGDVNYTNVVINAGVIVNLNGFKLYYSGTFTNNGSLRDTVVSKTATETTLRVKAGQNVIVGQCLVVPVTEMPVLSFTSWGLTGFYYAEITAKDSVANTITIKNLPNLLSGGYINENVLNAYWVPTDFMNKRETGPNSTPPFGPSLQIFRTKQNDIDTTILPYVIGPRYHIGFSALSHNGTAVAHFYDNQIDQNLTIMFEELEPGQELPRACKYISQVQNQLVQSGLPINYTANYNGEYPSSRQGLSSTTTPYSIFPDLLKYTEALFCDFQSVYWTDVLTPEGFPLDGIHEIAIDTKFADKMKGIAPNKDSLFAFKERSTAVISGDFANNDIVMEVLEADAGCISHRTIKNVRGYLVWLDGINGFYSCVAGRLPENIGFPIQDYQKVNPDKLNYNKAVAANFRKESLYVCCVEGTTFVLDYADNGNLKRNCWYVWDGFTGNTILATSDDKLLIRNSSQTMKMKLTGTVYDYTDDTSAIALVLLTAWMQQGFPTIDKHYIALWINSIQGGFTLSVKQYANFLNEVIGTQTNVQFIAESSDKKFVKAGVKACIPKLSSISWGMENAEKNKWVRIQGYELQYNADFDNGEPKR